MPNATWKQAERRLAGYFGSHRRPLSGGNDRRGRDDSLHPRLFLESKQSRTQMLWSLYLEIRKRASKEGRIPVIGLFQTNFPGCLLVLHIDDLAPVWQERLLALRPKRKRPQPIRRDQ